MKRFYSRKKNGTIILEITSFGFRCSSTGVLAATRDRMLIYFVTVFLVCLTSRARGQYYGNPTQQQYSPQQQQNQQQNSEAWRRWYYQQRHQQQQQQQQQASYSTARGRPSSPMGSPAASSQNPGYYSQPQSASSQYSQPQYQQYYQQRQPGSRQPTAPYNQQQGYGPPQQQGFGGYQPPPMTPPPPTTPAVPVEVEFEMEVITTTTTARPRPGYNQWGQYSQNYGPSGQYGGQYQPSSSYQQGGYQPSGPQSGGFGNYYPSPSQQQPPQTPTQQPAQTQQQYSQGGWSQPPQQQGQQPPPTDVTDPFSTKFDMNGLKPTVFNPQYQNQQQPNQAPNEFAGLFGAQNTQIPNPNAPTGKVDFGAKGPNPIQLNQFLAQPTAPKDANALDALLGSLLSGTMAAQGGQKISAKPARNTTSAPVSAPASSLVSDRLNGFVLGPKSEFRNNMFNDIPVNNAAYDSLNPLAGFMGETPPPPITTTPPPPGRNGDFLEGFIGVNRPLQPTRSARDNFQPNIYVYNPVNDAPATTTQAPPPPPPPVTVDQSLSNMGTQDLGHLVEKLLGVLAEKQVSGQAQGTVSGQV